MKTFQIQHNTNYTYSNPIVLDFHTLHLRPISNVCQRVTSFQLSLNPTPSGLTHFTDAEGNPTTFAWFTEKTQFFTIQTQVTVETLCQNPFDYLCTHNMQTIPISYTPQQQILLEAYLKPFSDTGAAKQFTHQLAKAVEYQTLAFLDALNYEIHSSFTHMIRETGEPFQPDELLTTRQGACRDFAYLFINSCRLLGIAARFVSGYQENPDIDNENHLHAWVEVYIPHAGWRGYDPSIGFAVTDGHIALATSAMADVTMPIIGTFYGSAVSQMNYNIQIMHTEQ
jgi:transglutaminase-like putative cysteine protease